MNSSSLNAGFSKLPEFTKAATVAGSSRCNRASAILRQVVAPAKKEFSFQAHSDIVVVELRHGKSVRDTQKRSPKALRPFTLSVRAVVRDTRGRCLLLRRAARCRVDPGKWDLPGGKVRKNEGFADCLVREMREETGLDIELTRVLCAVQSDLPEVRVVHLIMVGCVLSDKVRIGVEHDQYRWVFPREMRSLDLCSYGRSLLSRPSDFGPQALAKRGRIEPKKSSRNTRGSRH